ncbi:MAG: ribosome assembly cofactor RimP [Treponema sp.]|jgi:ribosome maturation factor RimP|nr:ribosome assembly cofactor RimP [Treponema sp.]
MKYTPREADPLFDSLEPVIRGLGMSLVELTVSRHRGSTHIRAVVYKAGVGLEDCSRAHHAILPRLELAFSRTEKAEELSVEVSSPGIERLIKDGAEFVHYRGRGIRCFRTDIFDWTGGILRSADEKGLVLQGREGLVALGYDVIAKAKLDYSQEV